MNFRIDKEFESFLPPLLVDERLCLKDKIGSEGCKPGALTVGDIAGDHVLLDGHNTLALCKEVGAEPCEPNVIPFADRAAAFEWVRRNQLARRNLTDEWRAYLIGSDYLARKRPHGDISRATDSQQVARVATCRKQGENAKNGSEGKAAEIVAETHGVSPRTVRNNAAFAEAVNQVAETQGPEAKAAVLSGSAGVTKAEVVQSNGKVFCAHCTRLVRTGQQAVKGCPDCKQSRKPKPPPPPPVPYEPGDDTDDIEAEKQANHQARQRNGKPVFDDRQFDEATRQASKGLTTFDQLLKARRKAFHGAEDAELHRECVQAWTACHQSWDVLLKAVKAWQKQSR